MAKMTRKKYQIFMVAFTLLILLGSGGLSYWIYDEYQRVVEEEEALRGQVAVAKIKCGKVASLEKEVIIIRENVNRYVKILPNTKEVNEFVKGLSDFANKSNVVLTSLRDDRRSIRQRKGPQIFDKESFRLDLRCNIFQFLDFISMIENYERFLKITEIRIKAGEYDEDTLRSDVSHGMDMLVETYVYHGNEGKAGATKIQNYNKKRDMIIDEIITWRGDFKIDHYEHVADPTIRDPFIDPRRWAASGKGGFGLDVADQEEFISGMMDKIFEVNGLLEYMKDTVSMPFIRGLEIRKEAAEKIIEINNRVNEAIEKRWITDPACVKKMDRIILPGLKEINKINTGDEEVRPSGVLLGHLTDMRDKLKTMLDTGDYERCVRDYELMKGDIGVQALAAAELDDERGSVINQIEKIYIKARAAREFYKIPIKISGIISKTERSVIIVNGQVLMEGQFVQEDLVVEKIETERVMFRYKNQPFEINP